MLDCDNVGDLFKMFSGGPVPGGPSITETEWVRAFSTAAR